MVQVVFGLGSNVGDRMAMLDAAVHMLAAEFGRVAPSAVYESAAVLVPGAPKEWDKPYLNMAVAVKTLHNPVELLAIAKHIERSLGRKDRGRWGPREIDVDILACADKVVDTPQLKIPHPELLKRDFALLPLAEVAPDWVFPGGNRTARELAAEMQTTMKRAGA